MGKYFESDLSGRTHSFAIKGDAPSPTEMERIQAILAQINSKLPKPEPAPVEGGIGQWMAEVGKGALRGGVLGLTATPLRAVGGLGDYLMGNEEPGLLNRVARGIEQGAEATAGPAPGYEGGFASTIGELAGMAGSFILPGMAATRLAAGPMPAAGKLTDVAAKAMASRGAKARLATEIGMGAATGSAEAGRRADMYEEQTGKKVGMEERAVANLIGAAAGTSFALPLERIAGPLAQVMKFVPKERKEDAAFIIANRIKDAATVGAVGAGQNVMYGLVQDLAENGLYNPDLNPADSMMQNVVAGGSVAGLLHFLIGRNLAKSNAAEKQLTDDLAKSEDGRTKPALDELSLGLGKMGEANNAEAQRWRDIGSQRANFTPATDTSAYEAAVARGGQNRQPNDPLMAGGRTTPAGDMSEVNSPMAQYFREKSDNEYAAALESGMAGRARTGAEGAANVGRAISGLTPEMAYFADQNATRRFGVRPEKNGTFSIVGPDGAVAGEPVGRGFKIYRSAEEATAVAKRLTDQLQRAEYDAYLKEANDLNNRRAADIAAGLRKGTPENISPETLTQQELTSLAMRRARSGVDPKAPYTMSELKAAGFDRDPKRMSDIVRANGGMTDTVLNYSEVPARRNTVDPVPERFPSKMGDAPVYPGAVPPVERYSSPFTPPPPKTKKGAAPNQPRPAAPPPFVEQPAQTMGEFAKSFERPDNYNLIDDDFVMEKPIKAERAEKAKAQEEQATGAKSESAEVPRFDVGEWVGFNYTKKVLDRKTKRNRTAKLTGEGRVVSYDPATRKYTVEELKPGGKRELHELFPTKQMQKKSPAGDAASGRRGPDAANDKAAGSASTTSGPEKATATPPQKQQEVRNLYSAPMDSAHPVAQKLLQQLRNAGLDDVQLRIVRWIDGNSNIEGRFKIEKTEKGMVKVIEIAEGNLTPDMDLDAITKQLGKVMNHEIVHALRSIGLLDEGKNFRILSQYVRNKFVPGKQYTYLQQAELKYSRQEPDVIIEEAIAAAYADFANGDLQAVGASRGIFSSIAKFFKKLVNWLDPTVGGADLMRRIKEGEFAERARRNDFQKKSQGPVSRDAILGWQGGKNWIEGGHDDKRLGDGEGHHTYGYGHYFAGLKDVARRYMMAGRNEADAAFIRSVPREALHYVERILREAEKTGRRPKDESLRGVVDEAAALIKRELDFEYDLVERGKKATANLLRIIEADPKTLSPYEMQLREYYSQPVHLKNLNEPDPSLGSKIKGYEEALRYLDKNGEELVKRSMAGHLYKVELSPDLEDFISWEIPLKYQSKKIIDAAVKAIERSHQLGLDPLRLRNMFTESDATASEIMKGAVEDMNGSELYRAISNSITLDSIGRLTNKSEKQAWKDAAYILKNAGLPGIRYLNQGARGGDPLLGKVEDHNFVLFEGKNAKILERYSRSAPDFVNMTEDVPIKDKTPSTPEEIRDSIGARVRFSLNNADAVDRIRNLEHAAASNALAKFIEPFTWLFDYKHQLMGSTKYKAPRVWFPTSGYGEVADYKGRAEIYADAFVRKVANRMIGLGRFIDLIKQNGGSVTEAYDSYMQNDAVIGKVHDELRKRNIAMYTPVMEKVSELGFKESDLKALADKGVVMADQLQTAGRAPQSAVFDLYLAALHARERNEVMKIINPKGRVKYDSNGKMMMELNDKGELVPIIENNEGLSGMTDDEAFLVINYVQRSPEFKKVDEAEQIVRQIIDSTNATRVEGELIPSNLDFRYNQGPMSDAFRQAAFRNPDLAYLAEKGYRKYVPLRGFADSLDGEDFQQAVKARGLQYLVRQDKRALGRKSPASHILEHALLQNEESVIREKYAQVGRSFLRMIEQNVDIASKDNNDKLRNTMSGMARIVANVPLKPTLIDGSYQTVYSAEGIEEQINVRGPHVAMMRDPQFREKLLDPASPYYAVRRYKLDANGEVPRDANGNKVGEIEEIIIEIFNDNLRAAMKGTAGHGSETLSMIVDHMGRITRFLANTVTSWNPEFLVANYQRDISEAIINAGQYEIEGLQSTVAKHSLPAMRALWKMNPEARKDFLFKGEMKEVDFNSLTDREKFYYQMAKEFEADGGPIEFLGMRDLASKIAHINEQFTRPESMNTLQKSMAGVGRLRDFVEAHNKAVENSTRLSVYIALREALEKKGMSNANARAQAAYAAKNITANYNRGGEWKAGMNAFYMFYNASLQGTWGLLTAAKRSKKVQASIMAIVAAGFINDNTQGLISDTDESGVKTYDKIKDWQLETRMIFMDPFGISERGYIAIPMPYSYGMFWNFGRSISRWMRGGYDLGEAVSSAAGGIIGALNPITGSHSFLNFMAPTLVDPIVDLSMNRNFQQRPIYKEPSQFGVQAPQSQLYWNSASAPAVTIADWVNTLTGGDAGISGTVDISPDMIDYTFGFLTGGVGKFISRITDTSWNAATGRLDDIETQDVPFVRQVFGSVGEKDDVEQYMKARQRVLQPERAVRTALESGDYQTAARLRQEYAEELRLAQAFKNSDAARNRLNTRLRLIRQNQNIPPAQKIEMERTIKQAIARQETRALTLYNRSLE